jgi:hypothetical protein
MDDAQDRQPRPTAHRIVRTIATASIGTTSGIINFHQEAAPMCEDEYDPGNFSLPAGDRSLAAAVMQGRPAANRCLVTL